MKNEYYLKPPLVELEGKNYFLEEYKSYSHYNYLKPGISSYLKTKHFETCLKLTKNYFNKCNVIDFGCSDGPFLPSLSKYFNNVVAIDLDNECIELASKMCKTIDLNNVNLICNKNLDKEEIKSLLPNKNYKILYLLETLEHIGIKDNLYGSKIDFIKDLFEFIDDDGIIVISVPKMVGISFLLQRLGLILFRLYTQPLSLKNLLKASFLKDTSDLEKNWDGGHLGFNECKLEKELKKNFKIVDKRSLMCQVIFIIKK